MPVHGDLRLSSDRIRAAGAVRAVHAGVDWDWELTSVSVWVFGLAGLALARTPPPAAAAPRAGLPAIRVLAALGCLLIAVQPALMWRSLKLG